MPKDSIYKVSYETRYSNDGKVGEWFDEETTVLANGDASTAVEKAMQVLLAEKCDYVDDETKKTVKCQRVRFRLVSVLRIAQAEIT